MQLRFFLIIFLLLPLAPGCAKKIDPPKVNLEEANKTFLKLVRDQYKYDVTTKTVGTTLWIYYPVTKNILEIKAAREETVNEKEMKVKPVVNYLEGEYTDGAFNFEYDISDSRSYKKSLGYASSYSEEYQRIQQNILTSIQQSYFDAAEQPSFVVMVVTDIVSGIEMESIFHFEDLKKTLGMLATMTQEEFLKRYVYELRGDLNAIDDKTGAHLNYRDIEITYFLTKQIINRVNFKYQRSSFPPSADTIKEMLSIAAETISTYQFQNFTSLSLRDLNSGAQKTVTKEELPQYLTQQ